MGRQRISEARKTLGIAMLEAEPHGAEASGPGKG
jgi:hypothetical protein